MFFIMHYMRTKSSLVRTKRLLPLEVSIHDIMKEMILSSNFKPPTKKALQFQVRIFEAAHIILHLVEVFHHTYVPFVDT